MLMFSVMLVFAQRGDISLESKSDASVWSKDANGEILMPGDWASATQVGTYRWVDEDDNPLGWIYGNNTYGDTGAAMSFDVDGEVNVHGAYVWFGAVASGDGDIHFEVYQFDGSIGDLIVSTSIPMNDVEEFPTGEGVTPDMYEDAFYVDFGMGVPVSGQFAFVVDYGDITWNDHGDGVGLASTVGSGAGIAWIRDADGVWGLATGVNPALTFDLGMFPHISTDDPPPGDTYMLTLNVDMTDAVAANDVEFDPAIHHVFVSGTFAGWAEPGSDPAFELHQVDNKGNRGTFTENWDSYDDWTTNLDPWTTVDVHGGATWTASDFAFDLAGQPFAFGIFNPESTDPSLVGTHDAYDGTKFAFSVGQTAAPAEENKWLISPAMEVTADSELSFAAKSITVQYGMERFKVYVSTDGTDLDDFVQISTGDYLEVGDDWEVFSFGLGDFAGETIHFAVECVSHDAFMFFLDAFEVTNLGGDPPPPSDEMVYTITLEVEEGDHQYKYFMVEDDPTWDMGEWEGDPNRSITVNADMTVNDEWAIITSIVEAEVEDFNMNLFPNPATTNITVRADVMIHEVKVYDITGRMVMQLDVNGHEQTLDVSTLRGGFYIMQVHTEQGVEGRRFNVAR